LIPTSPPRAKGRGRRGNWRGTAGRRNWRGDVRGAQGVARVPTDAGADTFRLLWSGPPQQCAAGSGGGREGTERVTRGAPGESPERPWTGIHGRGAEKGRPSPDGWNRRVGWFIPFIPSVNGEFPNPDPPPNPPLPVVIPPAWVFLMCVLAQVKEPRKESDGPDTAARALPWTSSAAPSGDSPRRNSLDPPRGALSP